MRVKWWHGLFLLFVLPLVVFRVMKSQPMRARLNNNPFALIATLDKNGKPINNNWRGRIGWAPDGFLTFQNPLWGVRAGFINLFQTYINRGLNTIEKIFPVYLGGVSDEKNNPDLYIRLVEKYTGIERDKALTVKEVFLVGRAIERVEQGARWVTANEFKDGWELAKQYMKVNE